MWGACWDKEEVSGREDTLHRVSEGEERVEGEVGLREAHIEYSIGRVGVGRVEERKVFRRKYQPPANMS